jgi:hypothetical protein
MAHKTRCFLEIDEKRGQALEKNMTHLDDLVYSILYITGQGGCDGVGKVSDPKGFCNILGRVGKSLMRRTIACPP